jgi:hypothetical protein
MLAYEVEVDSCTRKVYVASPGDRVPLDLSSASALPTGFYDVVLLRTYGTGL